MKVRIESAMPSMVSKADSVKVEFSTWVKSSKNSITIKSKILEAMVDNARLILRKPYTAAVSPNIIAQASKSLTIPEEGSWTAITLND